MEVILHGLPGMSLYALAKTGAAAIRLATVGDPGDPSPVRVRMNARVIPVSGTTGAAVAGATVNFFDPFFDPLMVGALVVSLLLVGPLLFFASLVVLIMAVLSSSLLGKSYRSIDCDVRVQKYNH